MMSPIRLYLISLLFPLIPPTRGFGLKRILLKFAGVQVGANVRVCSSVRILGNGALSIGDNTWIGHECLIVCSGSITIGANVDIAPRCYIGTGTHTITPEADHVAGEGYSLPIVVEDGAWLCTGVALIAGCQVGSRSVVLPGAVVSKAVPPLEMWGGTPAKRIRALV